MKRVLGIPGAIVALILLVVAYYTWAPRRTPAGQPPLVAVNSGNFEEFRSLFNAASGNVRVLLLLSPT